MMQPNDNGGLADLGRFFVAVQADMAAAKRRRARRALFAISGWLFSAAIIIAAAALHGC